MQVYFSHSYRDVEINSYFIDRLAGEDLPLRADQKTDVWCVSKLERYIAETTGFISVIPRRATDEDPGGYSPYIEQELSLARRARIPRLLFVDEKILQRHPVNFPEDAISFRPDALSGDLPRHDEAIRKFRLSIETTVRAGRQFTPDEVAVVAPGSGLLRDVARDAAEILRRKHFHINPLIGTFEDRGLDDISLLEALWRAELCVFLLDEKLSNTNLALAMAHASCIPSIRLQFDPQANECSTTVPGAIVWSDRVKMLMELDRQISRYREGLVRPVEIAQATGSTDAARTMGTMQWRPRQDNLWPINDGPGLLAHVRPEQAFVQDEANRLRRAFGQASGQTRGREASMQLCRLAYEGIRRYRFGYEIEPPNPDPQVAQVIRSPSQIETHKTANCLDLACLFASLIEAIEQAPILIVIDGPDFAHALVGVRAPNEPSWLNPQLGDLRRAESLGDAVFFEPTGAVESATPVGAEMELERQDKLLDFMTAKTAAARMLARADIQVRHAIDVQAVRRARG